MSSPKFLNSAVVVAFCRSLGNRIFTVVFERADGYRRTMNCRLNVKKGLKPKNKDQNPKPKTEAQKNVMTVFDLKSDGYRSFRTDHVFSVESAGAVLGLKTKFRKPKVKKAESRAVMILPSFCKSRTESLYV